MFDAIKRAAAALDDARSIKVKAHARTLPDGREVLVKSGTRKATPVTTKLARSMIKSIFK